MENKARVNDFMRLYKQEELESMNKVLGKPLNNKVFTKFELEALAQIELFDTKVVEISKIIWKNRNNKEKLMGFQKILNERINVGG